MDAEARAEGMDPYAVRVHASGRLSDLRFELSAEPELGEEVRGQCLEPLEVAGGAVARGRAQLVQASQPVADVEIRRLDRGQQQSRPAEVDLSIGSALTSRNRITAIVLSPLSYLRIRCTPASR